MHYANSFSCKEKLADRPEEIAPCGPGAARQQIRNDPNLVDRDRITWEYTSKVLWLPPGFSDEQVGDVIRVYADGVDDGEAKGEENVRREFRELMKVSRED